MSGSAHPPVRHVPLSAARAEALGALEQTLDVAIDLGLLDLALTHRSYAYEHGVIPHNERLEFLGDAVLGVVVTEALYRRFPDLPEGQLAKFRAAVVNARVLAEVARTIGLGDYLLLGRGEQSTGGREKSSILADAIEAVIGAAFVSGGHAIADGLVHRLVDPLIDQASTLGAGLDWKTSLQEGATNASLGLPEYRTEEEGPDHAKHFTAFALVGGEVLGRGEGRSKKVAEQQAAEQAYHALRERGLVG